MSGSRLPPAGLPAASRPASRRRRGASTGRRARRWSSGTSNTAPAPSPNSTQVLRSVQSTMRDSTSTPITSTPLELARADERVARSTGRRGSRRTPPTDRTRSRRAPRPASSARRSPWPGTGSRRVTVPTMMQSTRRRDRRPPSRQAFRARLGGQIAGRQRRLQDVALADAGALDDPGCRTCRPSCDRSSLVSTLAGHRAAGADDAAADHEIASTPRRGAARRRPTARRAARRPRSAPCRSPICAKSVGDVDRVLASPSRSSRRGRSAPRRRRRAAARRRARRSRCAACRRRSAPGHQGGADLGEQPRAHDLLAHHVQDRLRRALDALEHDVAGEAVGDDDVDLAAEDVAPLDVADVVEVGAAGRRRAPAAGARRASAASPCAPRSRSTAGPTLGRALPCSSRA